MRGVVSLLILALGCDQPAPDAPAPKPAEVAAPARPPLTTTAAPRTWSAQDIDQFVPVPPTREMHVPVPLDADPVFDRALGVLGRVVDTYGSDPGIPWAISHALLARGADFTVNDGTPAVDWLFSEYGEEFQAGGHTLVRFPLDRGEVRVEPHADLLLKVFTEIGVDPARPVQVQGHPHTVADLYRGSVLTTFLDPRRNHSSFASPNDLPWAIQALSAWSGGPLRWAATDGTPMNLDTVVTFSLAVLLQETRFLDDAMKAGADFDKEDQGIFSYTCGGAHLLQGVATAVAMGRGPPDAAQKVREQVPIAFYRLPRELRIYDAAQKEHPDQEIRLVEQRLKFTGHFLETMSKLASLGFYVPDAEQKRLLTGAAQQLVLSTTALHRLGAFDQLPAMREEDEQLFLDIVGDCAHATRGLELALGRGTVRY